MCGKRAHFLITKSSWPSGESRYVCVDCLNKTINDSSCHGETFSMDTINNASRECEGEGKEPE